MADETDAAPPPPPLAAASVVPPETVAPPETAASEEVLTVLDVPPPVTEKEVSPPKPPPPPEEVVAVVDSEKKVPQNLVSFKEESNRLADLSESERRALEDLKQSVQEALRNGIFTSQPQPPPPPPPPQSAEKPPEKIEEASEKREPNPVAESEISTQEESAKDENVKPTPNPTIESILKHESPTQEDVSIWGIPLLKDERSDVILLKFLRAREFKVKEAFAMLKNTIFWRKEFGIDALVDDDLGEHLEKVVFMHGFDRDGHPVCYNVYGEFQNKELYQKTFSDEEKRMKFLRWRIQFLERSIRKLDFTPGGVNTIVQINDLKNSPGPGKWELRQATKQALQLLQDNYPEFVAKQVFINVPWWYLAFYMMISPFLTQRTKSKFVFASPAKSAKTLFKYISPEQVPIQYGGLSVDYCDCNPDFGIADPVTEITVKPSTKQTVEILVSEQCVIVWEVRVVGWEVAYGAEFIPDAEDEYTVIVQKATKMVPTDDPVVCNSFKIKELGKIVITIDNPTSKKKKLLYRFKVKPYSN
ncbi:hypothetical protein PVL29_024751 [Vitis rotundifolia]|uniref:Patellin-3 n=1 Tax=Vitis rotundifolia TaxID=103349 RepID=A0AA38YSL6_VITRO|nr:hypothetical protein PVL29_024751 [Vitis rotundifolia]